MKSFPTQVSDLLGIRGRIDCAVPPGANSEAVFQKSNWQTNRREMSISCTFDRIDKVSASIWATFYLHPTTRVPKSFVMALDFVGSSALGRWQQFNLQSTFL